MMMMAQAAGQDVWRDALACTRRAGSGSLRMLWVARAAVARCDGDARAFAFVDARHEETRRIVRACEDASEASRRFRPRARASGTTAT